MIPKIISLLVLFMDATDLKKNLTLFLINGQKKKKNKPAFLLGDFNINSLNYHDHQPNNECLDFFAQIHLYHIVSPKHLLIIYSPVCFLKK